MEHDGGLGFCGSSAPLDVECGRSDLKEINIEGNVNKSNFDFERLQSAKRLKINKGFNPCPIEGGDEIYQNGIFEFNISKLTEYIKNNPDKFELIEIEVEDFPKEFSSLNEIHVESTDHSQPVILGEISPGRYNLIDGNHRMEKARIMGLTCIKAFKVNVDQHIKFLTDKDAYFKYVEYWNSKIRY